MKTIMNKVAVLILSVVSALCFTFAIESLSTVNVRADVADGVPTYQVTIKPVLASAGSLTTRLAPSEDAETVTFEYYVREDYTGASNYFNIVAANEDGSTFGYVNASGGAGGYGPANFGFTKNTYIRIVYNLENNTVTWSESNNGTNYNNKHEWVNAPLSDNATGNIIRYGISFGSSIATAADWQSVAMNGTFDVKCYDNLGKDLQVMSLSLPVWIDGVIAEPDKMAALTTMSERDAFIHNGTIRYGTTDRHMGSTDKVYLTQSEELTALGADGSVLAATMPQYSSTFVVQFGRTLTASDIAKGGSLVIRAMANDVIGNVKDCLMYRYDMHGGLTNVELSENYMSKIKTDAFTDIEIKAEDLAKLADSDGEVKGLRFWLGGKNAWPNADYTIYIDEVYYKAPVKVNLFDKNGDSLGANIDMYSGLSLESQTNIIHPEVQGFVPFGWTTSIDGTNFYDVKQLGYSENAINLYAKYVEAPTENYAGVYANSQNGKYFELTSDGKVVDTFGVTNFDTYQSGKGVLLFDKVNYKEVKDNSIIVGGQYVKQQSVYTVTYKVKGADFATIKVPEGYVAPDYKTKVEDYVFNGWELGNDKYTFNGVTENIVLNADIEIDAIAEGDAYNEYERAYYSGETGIIYIVKDLADGKRYLTKVENGTAENVGEYLITKSNKLYVGGKFYSFAPMTINNAAGSSVYVGPLSVIIDGAVYWQFERSFSFTIHYNNAGENQEQTDTVLTIDKTKNFAVDKPQDPVREGYTFKGWVLGDGTAYNFDKTITDDVEIYATWENNAEYTSGGCGSMVSGGNMVITAAAITLLGAVVIILRLKRGNYDRKN